MIYETYIGLGLIWGIVTASDPWHSLVSKLDNFDFIYGLLSCSFCSGTWFAVGVSVYFTEFIPLPFALIPIMAEAVSRWYTNGNIFNK